MILSCEQRYEHAVIQMELTLEQALQKGVEAHKAGKAQEADKYYTAILKGNPKHPHANHNMGVLAVGIGKLEAALPFFKTALEGNKTIAQFWLSYIDALVRLNRIDDAKAVLDQARDKGVRGDGFDQLEQQLAEIGKDVQVSGGAAKSEEPRTEQLQNLINLYTQGQYQIAQTQASQLLKQFPNSVNLYNIIGVTDKELGNLDEAIDAYNKALSIRPNIAEIYNNIGIILKDQGKLEEAIDAYNKALSIKPDYAEAYNNKGYALKDQVKLEESIDAFSKALSIKPDYAEAYNNMGITLKYQGKLEEAIDAFSKALSIKPDYAEAYINTANILKIYTPKYERPFSLFSIDNKIKKLSEGLINAKSNEDITDKLLEGLSYISDDSSEHKTPLSQIYKRNCVDLNCNRHMKIFNTKEIIPEFCFGCFKVQVEVPTFIDLIKVTSLFYKFDFEENLTKKTMIELRPNISGYYKGLIYCRGLDQAKKVKNILDNDLKEVFAGETTSKIKRGCSEYPFKFPDYGKIPNKPKNMMKFRKEWKLLENQFDQGELIKPSETVQASLPKFCVSDLYIIQKWIDYAKGIGDQSIETFNEMPIIFKDIYDVAKQRINS